MTTMRDDDLDYGERELCYEDELNVQGDRASQGKKEI